MSNYLYRFINFGFPARTKTEGFGYSYKSNKIMRIRIEV
jgi:hypothetical protein